MHPGEKDVLIQNFAYLVKNISTLNVLNHLHTVGIFNEIDCNNILKSRKPNRHLLFLLEKRGPYAFSEFLNSLNPLLLQNLKTLENDLSKLQI